SLDPHELERALSADPAGRREIEAPLVLRVPAQAVLGSHLHGVGSEVARGPDLGDVLVPADQSLAGEEAHGQLLVLAGGAHRDHQWFAIYADFQGFFYRQLVAHALACTVVELLD